MNMNRIDYEQLLYTESHTFTYNGEPFTGVAFEQFDDGSIKSEFEYRDGREHGVAREFYTDGSVKSETHYRNGGPHGVDREWYENGKLKKQAICEYGILTESSEYSEDGKVLKEYRRDEGDEVMQRVLMQRKEEASEQGTE